MQIYLIMTSRLNDFAQMRRHNKMYLHKVSKVSAIQRHSERDRASYIKNFQPIFPQKKVKFLRNFKIPTMIQSLALLIVALLCLYDYK